MHLICSLSDGLLVCHVLEPLGFPQLLLDRVPFRVDCTDLRGIPQVQHAVSIAGPLNNWWSNG